MKKETCPPGFKLRHILKASNRAITRVAWSPDGRLLASASYDQTVRLWDAETGKEIREILGYSGSVFTWPGRRTAILCCRLPKTW
ncbi:MAG: hypothetical protein M5U34_25405 [Chloroflexi bacterium]|nr:hypothetical protein [Chloroflexota bacterium]